MQVPISKDDKKACSVVATCRIALNLGIFVSHTTGSYLGTSQEALSYFCKLYRRGFLNHEVDYRRKLASNTARAKPAGVAERRLARFFESGRLCILEPRMGTTALCSGNWKPPPVHKQVRLV